MENNGEIVYCILRTLEPRLKPNTYMEYVDYFDSDNIKVTADIFVEEVFNTGKIIHGYKTIKIRIKKNY